MTGKGVIIKQFVKTRSLMLYYTSVSENPRFYVADFATLSDERRLSSKIVLLLIRLERTLRLKI